MHLVNAAVLDEWDTLSDSRIAAHVVGGRTALFEVLMRRHDERAYRTVRAITGDDSRAEELLQQVFIDAYANLRQFDGTTSFEIWLTRIAVKAAAGRPLGDCPSLVDRRPDPCTRSGMAGRAQGLPFRPLQKLE